MVDGLVADDGALEQGLGVRRGLGHGKRAGAGWVWHGDGRAL